MLTRSPAEHFMKGRAECHSRLYPPPKPKRWVRPAHVLSTPTSELSEPQKRLMNLNACLVAQDGGAYEAANRKKA
jgi:hypothetical protein